MNLDLGFSDFLSLSTFDKKYDFGMVVTKEMTLNYFAGSKGKCFSNMEYVIHLSNRRHYNKQATLIQLCFSKNMMLAWPSQNNIY